MANQWEYKRSDKRVIGFCLLVGAAAMAFGLGSGETSGFLAMPVFNDVFGQGYDPVTGIHFLTAGQQTIMNGATLGSAAVSAAVAGNIGTHYGRRIGLFIAMFFGILTAVVQIATTTWGGLVAGRIIGGFGAGFGVLSVVPYWAETSPAHLRGMIIVFYQGIVNVSQFVGQCINQGTYDLPNRWSYRAPLITEFLPPLILLSGLYWIPETPRWYATQGRSDDAITSMRRIRGPTYPEEEIQTEVADIIAMVELEKELEGASTWANCFRGTDLRRTLLCMSGSTLLEFSGFPFIASYGTLFFQLSGVANPFFITVITGLCGIAGSATAIVAVRYVERRHILIGGAAGQGISMFIFAIVSTVAPNSVAASRCLSAFVSLFIFIYGATWGAVIKVLLGELSSTALRSRTIALAMCCSWLSDTLIVCGIPYLLSPDYANLGGKVGFIFGGCEVLALLWAILFVPETKDRTLEEIDEMFMNKVPAWKFKSYSITRTIRGRTVKE